MPGSGLTLSFIEHFSFRYSARKIPSCPHPLHRRIEERLFGDRRLIAPSEVLDLKPCPHPGMLGRHPGVSDALSERVSEVGAGYVADRPVGPDRLAAHDHHVRIVEHQAHQLLARYGFLAL